MKKIVPLLLVLTLTGGGPEEVTKKYAESMESGAFEEAKKYVTQEHEKNIDNMKQKLERAGKKMSDILDFEKVASSEVYMDSIAVVSWCCDQNGEEVEQRLNKIDGTWKVAPLYKPGPKEVAKSHIEAMKNGELDKAKELGTEMKKKQIKKAEKKLDDPEGKFSSIYKNFEAIKEREFKGETRRLVDGDEKAIVTYCCDKNGDEGKLKMIRSDDTWKVGVVLN